MIGTMETIMDEAVRNYFYEQYFNGYFEEVKRIYTNIYGEDRCKITSPDGRTIRFCIDGYTSPDGIDVKLLFDLWCTTRKILCE